jgi:type I restriction enzyme, S subunit
MSSQKVPKGYKQTEVGVIPEDWEVDMIGQSMRLLNGRAFKPSDWMDQGTPIIRIQNLNDSSALFNYCSIDTAIEDKHRIEAGNLVFAWSGTKGTSFGARIWTGPSGVLNQHIFKILPDDRKLTIHYAFLVLLRVQEEIEKQAHGFKASFVHVKKSDLVKVYLPIPPIAEQKLIACALSDIDALIEGLEGTIGKKRYIRQGAMQELLTGKRRLPGFSEQWEVKRFGELVAPRSERVDPRKSGIHNFCIELEHIGSGTGFLLGSTTSGKQSSLKSVFYQGDVLFGKLRAYLRKYWQADCSGVCSTEIWVLSPKDNLISTAYLFQIVQTDQFIETATLSYGTHMPRSDWSIVKNYELLSPPTIKEQTAIATILSDMDAEIATLEAKLTKTRQLKQGMMHELLTGRIRLI